jgi:hypothetical protein
MCNTVKKSILSATLKAEAIRIRYLRRKAKNQFRRARQADMPQEEIESTRSLAHRLLGASGCPSQRARCANLALGILRSTPYLKIELSTKTPTWYLYGHLAKEVAAKAGIPYEDVVAWMQVKPKEAGIKPC